MCLPLNASLSPLFREEIPDLCSIKDSVRQFQLPISLENSELWVTGVKGMYGSTLIWPALESGCLSRLSSCWNLEEVCLEHHNVGLSGSNIFVQSRDISSNLSKLRDPFFFLIRLVIGLPRTN